MAQEFSDVLDLVFDHGGSFQGQPPAEDPQVLWQAHGLEHFRSEHTGVPDLDPLLQTLVPGEDLHRGLGVGVVSGLESQTGDTHSLEELLHELDQVAQSDVVVGQDTFDLVELSEMGGIDGLVTEHTVDGEQPGGLWVLGQRVQHSGGDGGGVRSQDQFLTLLGLPVVTVTDGAELTLLVDGLDVGHVGFVHGQVRGERVLDVERVLQVTGRVLLWDVQGVEVPEPSFDVLVGGHFREAHGEEDLSELFFDLVQGVQRTGVHLQTLGVEVVRLELQVLVCIGGDHV